ncbi:phage terminase large subunit [Helicobacter pylori]
MHTLELSSEFRIKVDKIEANNGSTFLFKGMQEYNAGNIKSIADINITWIEEAQYFSERSWELLVPSVIRAKFFILYSLFFILYSLFFILYSLFFILSLVLFFISFVFNFFSWGWYGVVFEWFYVFLDF